MQNGIAKTSKFFEDDEDERLTYEQVEARFGLKRGTLYALVHQRRVPHYRLSGRLVLFSRRELEAWFTKHAVDVVEPNA